MTPTTVSFSITLDFNHVRYGYFSETALLQVLLCLT